MTEKGWIVNLRPSRFRDAIRIRSIVVLPAAPIGDDYG